MFGWFRPSCPCDAAAKDWIEERLLWLADEFELEGNAYDGAKQVILPTHEFFPDPYEPGDDLSARTMFARVCGYMGVSPETIQLELMDDPKQLGLVDGRGQMFATGAAGLYSEGDDRFHIRIARGELLTPMSAVGTMAHELAHVRLLGENRLSHDAFDNEILTDLTVVFHGLGVFLANLPRNWPADYTYWPGTRFRKPEYLTPPMFGYALAHLAWFQDNDKAPWIRSLEWGARANVKQGLRYLRKTGHSRFKPWHARIG
jgi:hypothetical protein